MAKPIKETPFLRGKDAREFAVKIARAKDMKAPREEYERVMANYKKLKVKS